MASATYPFMTPFTGAELLQIEVGDEPGLWRVKTVAFFCDNPTFGDQVTIHLRTMMITEVIRPAGLISRGGLYDPTGTDEEVNARWRRIKDHLTAHGMPSDCARRGLFAFGKRTDLSEATYQEIIASSPEKFTVNTAHARLSYANLKCPDCGYLHPNPDCT